MCANLVYRMAECDNLVDHPPDLKLLCLSQLHDLKDRIKKNNISEGMKMFRKFLIFLSDDFVLANVLNDLSFLLPHQLFYLHFASDVSFGIIKH